MQELDKYLVKLEEARKSKDAAYSNYLECKAEFDGIFSPLGCEPSEEEIAKLYELCPKRAGYPRSHILVFLVLLFYAPVALYGGRIPLGLATRTASVAGVKPPAIYTARRKVAWWIRVYRDFYRLVLGLYERIVKDKVICLK